MKVRTSCLLDAPPEAVWPLLCESAMRVRPPLVFWLGIPRPRSCGLVSAGGGVGAERVCRADRGSIRQRIVEWEEPRRFAVEMVETDLSFARHVARMADTFDLEAIGPGRTRITRRTQVVLAGRFRAVKAVGIYLGLKAVHRYVFRNWALLLRDSSP